MADIPRELVIGEAKRLFFQFGFRRITMDEIAGNLRMSKKTLYALFPSKEELVRAVVETILQPNLKKILALTRESASVAEFFGRSIEVFRELGRSISDPMMSDMRSMPEIWRDAEARRVEVLSHIKEVLERGKRSGELRSELHVDLFLRMFIQMVNSVGNPTTMMELNLKPTELAEQIHVIFFRGIVNPEHRPGGAS